MKIRHIEIFAKTNNKKGDLFCRLMGDFFHSIGYGEPRYDIHKSGREIDINAKHRTETKIAIAECKAHQETIGGSDINKFFGALSAEKIKYKKNKKYSDYDIIGYFISLSGFKETAIEQEEDLEEKRLILIDKKKIIDELVAGRIIVPIEQAINNIKFKDQQPFLLNEVDLIAHSIGWIWVLYYGGNNTPTHFSLIHADGKALLTSLSKELIGFDNTNKKRFSNLIYLEPQNKFESKSERLDEAQKKYFQYIKNECGNIQFDGLPTDKDAGSVKVELENIFQPLHLEKTSDVDKESKDFLIKESSREPVGDVLRNNTRLAILAKPGGGKSTLLKRIANAYSFHEKLKSVDDKLPAENWFPIFIRCRELGDFVTRSITEIIGNIPNRAEISSYKDDFTTLVSDSLQNGSALLLIDGLDEIANDKSRLLFVNQLRTFLATYPNIHIITTSREAGFRLIGDVLAIYCEQYRISSLIPAEIKELIVKWYKAIIDDSKKTISDAIELSEYILEDKRIQVLAENPLLLTTLLFVKRWAGYLPTKKSVLYQEMIKLLLVTWNVEGHEQLDIDEAEPQLSYLAYWMTLKGSQTINYDELKKCLQQARKEMPDILGYTNISVSDFIKRVESRSSLLILSGHEQLGNGSITPIYEFLHLSFQEYLTAKAVVEKYLPQKTSKKSSLDIIKPHISKENWKEVIPLIAVLSKREVNDLISFLIDESKNILNQEKKSINPEIVLPSELLGSCIASEIQIKPNLLKLAIEWFAKSIYTNHRQDLVEIIDNSKFTNIFSETIRDLFFSNYDDQHVSALGGMIGKLNIMHLRNDSNKDIMESIQTGILNNNREKKCIGFLSLMNFVYEYEKSKKILKPLTIDSFEKIENELYKQIQTKDKQLYFSAAWSIAWLGEKNGFFSKRIDEFILVFFGNWLNYKERNLSRISAWSLFSIIDLKMDLATILSNDTKTLSLIKEKVNNPKHEYDQFLGVYIGILLGIEFDRSIIEDSIKEVKKMRFKQDDKLNKIVKYLKIELGSNNE